MNIRNNTIIDEYAYTAFQLFRKQTIKRSRPITSAIYAILTAAVLTMLIYSFITLNLYYIIGSAIFAFLLYREINNAILKPRKMFVKNNLQPVSVQYLFQRNSYKILEDGKNEDDIPSVKYEQIKKAYETKAFFYLFFNKNLANIVAKSGFDKKAENHFRENLKSHLGKSYIKCK